VDVLLPAEAVIQVKKGQRVKGGARVLALMPSRGTSFTRGEGL
jgi:hypothetical protein